MRKRSEARGLPRAGNGMPERRFNELEDISPRLSANRMISKKSVHERLKWIKDE